MGDWLSGLELANLAGISPRKARAALAKANLGGGIRWRGASLQVAQRHGRGGLAGTQYVVRLDSLPPELRLRFEERSRALEGPIDHSDSAARVRDWWWQFLAPVRAHEKGTRDRAAAMRALAGQRISGPDAEWFTPALRTIERMAAKADLAGWAGLTRKKRTVTDKHRAILSDRWDAATVHLEPAARTEITEKVRQRIRDLWGSGAQLKAVARLASEYLLDLTVMADLSLDPAELREACALPGHLIAKGRPERRVHEYRTNVKAWDDTRPRVRLTSAGLTPMALVYGDVHHFDVIVRRTDGSIATPKGIAWLDAATGRVRVDLVLCEPGTGVRNADLIESFVAMTQDPRWGVPARLYLDNGSEYRFADLARDALKLGGLGCDLYDKADPITRAQAYNAAAKGILEGTFRCLEAGVLRPLKGYIGGDRMKSRSGNLGKAPEPYGGTFEKFCALFEGLLEYFNSDPVQGDLRGLSPRVAFDRAVSAGWTRMDIDPLALMMAFSVREERKITDGKINFDSEAWYCDELMRYNGEKVIIHRAKFQRWNALPVYTMTGELIGVAQPDPVFDRLSSDGAVEAGRRKTLARADILERAAALNPIDVSAEMVRSGQRQPPSLIPESAGTIQLGDELAEVGRQVVEAPAARRDRENQEKQRAQKERLEWLEQQEAGR